MSSLPPLPMMSFLGSVGIIQTSSALSTPHASVTLKILLWSLTGQNADLYGDQKMHGCPDSQREDRRVELCIGWGECPSSLLFQGFPQSWTFSRFGFLLLPIHCVTNYWVQNFYSSASHNMHCVHRDETGQKDQNSVSIRMCRMGVCGWKNNPEYFEKFFWEIQCHPYSWWHRR